MTSHPSKQKEADRIEELAVKYREFIEDEVAERYPLKRMQLDSLRAQGYRATPEPEDRRVARFILSRVEIREVGG